MAQPIVYTRNPLEPFMDARVETYCRSRAAGVSQAKCCEEAGIAKATAQTLDRHDDVAKRIAELKDATRDFTGISQAWVMDKLRINIEGAIAGKDYKSANQGLAMMTKLIKDHGGNVADRLGTAPARKALREDFRSRLGAPAVIDVEEDEPEPVEAHGEPITE